MDLKNSLLLPSLNLDPFKGTVGEMDRSDNNITYQVVVNYLLLYQMWRLRFYLSSQVSR